MGYVDGRNLLFDWRNQPDEAAAAATIKKWVADKVDVIVVFEDQWPGGNLTGVLSNLGLIGKRLNC